MSDEPPPLVDRPEYASQQPSYGGWSTVPGTPMWGMNAAPAQYPPTWGAYAPWPATAGATPMFPPHQPMPGWGASPAVTQIPFATGTTNVAQGNDDWVHIQPAPASAQGWEQQRKDYPEGFGTVSPSRSFSRQSSARPQTPFSGDPSPSSGTSDLSRARSWQGGGILGPVRETDKRPPREWRSDFSMSKGSAIGAALGSILQLSPRPKSAARRGSLSIPKVALNPYIRYSPSAPTMFLDLRESPDHVRFRELPRAVNPWDLSRFACEPPLPVMILYSPSFPWYIEARTKNPVGVTLHEMFEAIWLCMMTPITQEDYYNNEMDQVAREGIAFAWAQRCGDNVEERNKGVRRVDFLMEKVGLEGLVKGKDGYFELKVKKV